jgi:thioredoxin-like negative regulator of GroEL
MKTIIFALFLAIALPVSFPGWAASHATYPEARPFDQTANADQDVNLALAAAKAAGNTHVIMVLGANWCHDSRALSGWFATPRFAAMLKTRYRLVYVDVGASQPGERRNLQIAQRFGIKKIKGTPTVMILSAEGKLLNRKDAPKWRNAASRSEDAIYRYFAEFTGS